MTNKTEEATDGKAVEGKADAAGCKPKESTKRAAEESTAKAAAAKDPTKEAADKNKAVEKLSAENSS